MGYKERIREANAIREISERMCCLGNSYTQKAIKELKNTNNKFTFKVKTYCRVAEHLQIRAAEIHESAEKIFSDKTYRELRLKKGGKHGQDK